ncbi:MAG TPA: TonB-dependent receptor [Bacteroidales bacterium]
MNRLISFISTRIRLIALFTAIVEVFVLTCDKANAQSNDSVHQLKSVTISADRLHTYNNGLNIITIDSITLERYNSDDAATLLSTQTPVYIKSYGQGGLATLSIRGTLAMHTGVYWNGVNINQPNLGMTDLSLVPMFFFESVALQYGGSSALFGSGNIGGGLHLENHAHLSSPLGIKVTAGMGSFDEYLGNAKVSYGGKTISYAGGFALKSNENDFLYTDSRHQRVRQKNASFSNNSLLQQFDLRTGANSLLSAGFWLQHSDRDLPAALNVPESQQHQQDDSYRTYIKWGVTHNNKIIILRSAWLVDKMHYTNPQASIDAHYLTRTILLETEYNWYLSTKTRLGVAANSSVDMATIEAYQGNRRQMKGSVLASLQQLLPIKDWILTANIRKEWIESYHVPFLPSLGAEGKLISHFKAKLNMSLNFRAPTLNDRYWQPGGNPDLKPETSWNGEAGIIWANSPDKIWQADIGVTAYYSVINDLILWTPIAGSIIWSPENIQKIFSRGVELNGHATLAIGSITGAFRAAYSYTPSTFAKNDTSVSSIQGKQLTYIPLHNAVAGLRLNRGPFFMEWEQSLTGKRYTLNDNSDFLDGYLLSNFTVGSLIMVNKSRFRIQGVIRNLFNTSYQPIQNFAVPGRNFLITINLSI